MGLFGQRWLRFGLVGIAATVSYYILGLVFVTVLNLHLLLGNFLAYAISFIVSYLGQSKWTFESGSNHAKTLPRFAATQIFGLGINSAIIKICATIGIVYEISMLVAIVIVPVFVFFICKYWVFPSNSKKSG